MRKQLDVVVLSLVLGCACKSAPEAPPDTVPPPDARENAATATRGATRPAQEPRVYGEATTQIDAQVGERFEIALPANVTTPFKWSLVPQSLSDVASLSAQTYTDAPPADCDPCVGYPGTAHFVLDAAQEGETTLKLSYRGLGDGGQVKRELNIALRVRP